ncbi:MAG: spore cortex-lytic enzyme, partial [Eubacteriaceae bacterium]|nr:spore cortex-lytic enzyme [Eubacteriaceae bacterium]
MDTKKISKALLIAVLILSVCVASVYATSLKQGTQDAETVRKVQTRLKSWGYYFGAVDGSFGPLTEQAVRYFQQKNGLKVDGIIGKATFAALGLPMPQADAQTSSVNSNDADVQLLARCINGEARGEPYEGQVAVGAVILNRLRHPEFPNTLSAVIYQAGAFDAVADGQINLSPSDSTIRAARDAMNGWDPTNGCIYYYNPVTATNKWIRTRPIM